MTHPDLARHRLHAQRLVGAPFGTPAEVVEGLCAVQAQDYYGATWALGQRTAGADSAAVGRAFNEGAILRTHVLRPTWHFVRPADIRWMLALTAPRVTAAMASYDRRLELDTAVFLRSHALLAGALRGGRHLTRLELGAALRDGGIVASGQRLAHLMMRAEQDALVCSGPRRGKQLTYALLDERVPPTAPRARDEALAALALRYFTSHGPATVRDFAWWSGLSAPDSRAALGLVESRLVRETVDGGVYWRAPSASAPDVEEPLVHLLPNYDEHIVAYKDHRASLDERIWGVPILRSDALAAHLVVLNGRVIGGWRRTLEKSRVVVETDLPVALTAPERAALESAAEGYGRFLGLPVALGARS